MLVQCQMDTQHPETSPAHLPGLRWRLERVDGHWPVSGVHRLPLGATWAFFLQTEHQFYLKIRARELWEPCRCVTEMSVKSAHIFKLKLKASVIFWSLGTLGVGPSASSGGHTVYFCCLRGSVGWCSER